MSRKIPTSNQTKLSDHCVIDHFEKVEGWKEKHTLGFILRLPLLAPLLLLDRKMHFTGLRGGIWRALGVDRSHKNPNICNV